MDFDSFYQKVQSNQNAYYELTGLTPWQFMAINLIAYHQGSKVFIDEFNSHPIHNRDFYNYFAGIDPKKRSPIHKGYAVLGAQNSSAFGQKRSVIPGPLLNRFDFVSVPQLNDDELLYTLIKTLPKMCAVEMEKLFSEYLQAKKYAEVNEKKPIPSTRHLYSAAKQIPNRTEIIDDVEFEVLN
jgi:hypothetical protein